MERNGSKSILIIVLSFSLILLSGITYARPIVPENVTVEYFNTIEILDDNNKAKITTKILFTNPNNEFKEILNPDKFVLNLYNTDIVGTPQADARYHKNFPVEVVKINDDYSNIEVDLNVIPLNPFNYDYVEVTYIVNNLGITINENFVERRYIEYRFTTLEDANSYNFILKIPRKDFSDIHRMRLISSFPPPNNFYETEEFYEYVWSSIRFPERHAFLLPMIVTYEYYYGILALVSVISDFVLVTVAPFFIWIILEKMYRKFKRKLRQQLPVYTYILKAYDENGNEINCKEEGFKEKFTNVETAHKFIEFYKELHPKFRFEIIEIK